MKLNELVKEMMVKHKNKIEVFQWAVINGVASLIYSKYISCMRWEQTPVPRLVVPEINQVKNVLSTDGPLMTVLSDHLIDDMIAGSAFTIYQYWKIPELEIFTIPENASADNPDEGRHNIEVLKTILDLYIIPNVSRVIPNIISKKFDLEHKSSSIKEDPDLIFCHQHDLLSDSVRRYLADEIAAQLMMFLPSGHKDIRTPEAPSSIPITRNDIMTVDHQNSICPIHFSSEIFENSEIMSLLSFVTNITVTNIDWHDSNPVYVGGMQVRWTVDSNPFNQVTITRIQFNAEETKSVPVQ